MAVARTQSPPSDDTKRTRTTVRARRHGASRPGARRTGRRTLRWAGAVGAAVALIVSGLAGEVPTADAAFPDEFVHAQGTHLSLRGSDYAFAGANNYYLGHKSAAMIDAVLDDAAGAGLDVIRTWGFQDYQNRDGSGSVHKEFSGVWYQAWDAQAGAPVINSGPDGLQKLDYVIAGAASRGIRLIIPFVNHWNDYGGMDQYVRWGQTAGLGTDTHADFYTHPTIRGWYRTWVRKLLNRVNTITGIAYKDDPSILAWELANEPRCSEAGTYPAGTCTSQTLITWAAEMSTYVKSIDKNHLLSVGDEGFFCRDEQDWVLADQYGASSNGAGFGEDCNDGVDTVALASLPHIDAMSLHLYPDRWGTSPDWGRGWILEHADAAAEIGKPVYLGEFGLIDRTARLPVYHDWLNTVRNTGFDGALYWMLASTRHDGTPYTDTEGLMSPCPSAVCELMSTHDALVPTSLCWATNLRKVIADDDYLDIERANYGEIDVLDNDIAFTLPVEPETLDLDPGTPGRQTEKRVTGGRAKLVAARTVRVVPDIDYTGTLVFPYTVENPCSSARAVLTVDVLPAPGGPEVLASWERGVSGWAPTGWLSVGAIVTTDTRGATHGERALRVTSPGEWFRSDRYLTPLDLTGRSSIEFDVTADELPTGKAEVSVALRVGKNWTMCSSPERVITEFGTQTMSFPFTEFSCDGAERASIHDILIYLGAGQFSVDRLTVR
ncbi:glycoside hydrolase 5 family protein [Microbacterium sp.]|uniref:glycoside hydrolase 5 family protein n=1 Tax=Microbacterium sp. TaxID=51671 RepID=UPI003A8C5F71